MPHAAETDREASRLGFGCARIGSFNNAMSARDTRRLLEEALDLGITLFDTADIYGQGESERAVGRLLQGRRHAAFVVTKVGKTFSRRMRVLRPLKPIIASMARRSSVVRAALSGRRDASIAADFTPAYIRRAIDASLRRLRFDTVDGLLLHSPTATQLRTEGLAEVLQEARALGKIRFFGVACDDVETTLAALEMHGVDLMELPPCVLHAAEQPLREAAARGVRVLVREVIRYRGDMSPMVAIASTMRHPAVSAVIAGTSSFNHLRQLAETAGLGRTVQRSNIEQASPSVRLHDVTPRVSVSQRLTLKPICDRAVSLAKPHARPRSEQEGALR